VTTGKNRLRGIDEFREEDTLAARIDQRRALNKMHDAVEAEPPTRHAEHHARAPGDEIYAPGKRWSRTKTVFLIVGLAVVGFFSLIFVTGMAEASALRCGPTNCTPDITAAQYPLPDTNDSTGAALALHGALFDPGGSPS